MSDQRQNPFAAPTAALEQNPEAATGYETASIPQRIATLLADYTAYFILAFSLFRLAPDDFALKTLLGYPGLFNCYVAFESIAGWTPGKLIAGTRVVDEDGRRPKIWKVLGRTLARIVPLDALSVFFYPDRRCWHDRWSGTRVVTVRRK